MAVISCSGVLRPDDARQGAEELWKLADWPGRCAVWDFHAARFDFSASEVRGVAEFILTHQPERPPARVAFVSPRDVDFGLARMFGAFRDDPNTEFRVFRDHDEALSWARSLEPAQREASEPPRK